MKIKRFNEDNKVSLKGDNNDINYRFNLNKQVFNIALQSLRDRMVKDFDTNPKIDWSDVANLSYINESLINLMEGWDENKAAELREMLKY